MIWHIVYLSYESKPGGRNYIGKHSTKNIHDKYMGSFSDKSFSPDTKIVLGVFRSPEAAVKAEIQWQRVFEVAANPEFANRSYQTSDKFDTTGLKVPKEVREKISSSSKGRKKSEETRRKMSEAQKGQKRRPLSEATKFKMSEKRKGQKKSEEHRRKIAERLKGRTICQEQRDKLREANLGKKASPETREKQSKSRKGKKLSPSHSKAISQSLIGHPVSEKSRATAREVAKEYFPETNTRKFRCLVTGKVTTAGPLTVYQRAREIDPSLRERYYD